MKDTVVVAFGRMNPPTPGHKKLLDVASKVAKKHNADFFFAVSRTQDKKKNPISYPEKLNFIKKLFPLYSKNILDDASIINPIFLLKHFNKKYKKIIFIAGSDRVSQYEKLLNDYNGKDYTFESIEIVSAGERDPDSDDVEGMSASKLRALVVNKDFEKFKTAYTNDLLAKEIYDSVKDGMQLKESVMSFKQFRKML